MALTTTLTLKVTVNNKEEEDCYDMKDCLFASRNDVGADIIRGILMQFIDVVFYEGHSDEVRAELENLRPTAWKTATDASDTLLNFECLSWRCIARKGDEIYVGYVMFDVEVPQGISSRELGIEFIRLFDWYCNSYMFCEWSDNGYVFDVARIDLTG